MHLAWLIVGVLGGTTLGIMALVLIIGLILIISRSVRSSSYPRLSTWWKKSGWRIIASILFFLLTILVWWQIWPERFQTTAFVHKLFLCLFILVLVFSLTSPDTGFGLALLILLVFVVSGLIANLWTGQKSSPALPRPIVIVRPTPTPQPFVREIEAPPGDPNDPCSQWSEKVLIPDNVNFLFDPPAPVWWKKATGGRIHLSAPRQPQHEDWASGDQVVFMACGPELVVVKVSIWNK